MLDGVSVGTGRMLEGGHIGRIAVLKAARNQGVGRSILKALVNVANKQDCKRVYLGAQIHATEFYEKLGFKICSEVFMDAGLEDIEMDKLLG